MLFKFISLFNLLIFFSKCCLPSVNSDLYVSMELNHSSKSSSSTFNFQWPQGTIIVPNWGHFFVRPLSLRESAIPCLARFLQIPINEWCSTTFRDSNSIRSQLLFLEEPKHHLALASRYQLAFPDERHCVAFIWSSNSIWNYCVLLEILSSCPEFHLLKVSLQPPTPYICPSNVHKFL